MLTKQVRKYEDTYGPIQMDPLTPTNADEVVEVEGSDD